MGIFIYLLSLLFIIIEKVISKYAIDTVFSPSIHNQLDFTSTQSYNSFQLAKKSQLLFLVIGKNTIQIIDEKNDYKIILESNIGFEINDNFLVTTDGKYIILLDKNRLIIYEYNLKQLTKVYSDDQNELKIQTLSLNKQEDKIIMCRGIGNLEVIYLNSKQRIKYVNLQELNCLSLAINENENLLVISDYLKGTSLYKVEISQNQILLQLIAYNSQISFYKQNLIINDKFLVGLDNMFGISIFDIGFLQNMIYQNDFQPIKLTAVVQSWQVFDNYNSYSTIIDIDKEEQFIYIGSRYIDIVNPKIFQIIKYNQEEILQVQVSFNNNFLFLATKENIILFKREKAILLQDYPNFYNKHISLSTKINDTTYSWRSQLISNEKYLIISCYDQGLIITQINNNNIYQPLSMISHITQPPISYIDSFLLICTNRYLIVPLQDKNTSILEIYDINDLSNPISIQNIQSISSQYVFGMSKNVEETIFTCEADFQLLIYQVDCGGLQVISKISEFKYPSFIQKAADDVLLLNGYTYIILLFRASHILLIDVQNLLEPRLATKLEILGGETIIQSKYNKQYCFIADGLEGISIIDLQQLPKIVYQQKINIKGYINYVNLIQNDQFIVVSQLSGGQVSLIDIRDINKPKQISVLQYKDENSSQTSITSDSQQLFVISPTGIRIVPLQANVTFHYEIQEIIRLDSGSVTYNRISDLTKPFLVGQEILISLNQLYPQKGSQVTNVYFVEDGRLKNIPNWIEFDKNKNQITIYAQKESLMHSQENSESEQTTDFEQKSSTLQSVVFETKFLIQENSFCHTDAISNKEVIDLNTSIKIFRSYKEKGVINQSNQLSAAYSGSDELYVPYVQGVDMDENLQKYISFVLQNSLAYSPVDFMIENSLIVYMLNQTIFIQSHSKTAIIQLKINNFDGRFYSKSYPGITTFTSDRQDQIKLEGQIQKLNLVLSQKIILYIDRKIVNVNNITSFLTINDGINNEYQNTLDFEQLQNIVQFKEDISILSQNKLQKQIERQFEDSIVNIESQVSIEFSFSSYENAIFTDLTIQAYLVQSSNSTELILNQFQNIQFLPQQFKFLLKTTYSDFYKQYCFKINATDSYSWIEDTFCVNVQGVSFNVLLAILFQVGGPIFFIFGLSQSWYKVFNIFFYKDNIICTRQIREHQKFVHKFIIINDTYKIGCLLFHKFLKELQKKEKKLQLSYRNTNKNNKINQPIKEFKISSCFIAYKQIQYKFNMLLNKNLNSKTKKLIISTLNNLQKINSKNLNNQGLLSKYYINNEVNTKDFITDIFQAIKSIEIENKVITTESLFFELNDTGSLLFNCIKGLLIKEVLKYHKKSYIIYEYIKKYCFLQEKYTKYNWQSLLTSIVHSEKKKKYNQDQIIPKVNFKEEELLKILYPLVHIKEQNKQYINNKLSINYIEECLKINIILIKNTICEDAIGLIQPTQSSLYPNYGESIHVYEHQIKQIRSFISNPRQSSKGIIRCFEPSYLPIILKANQNLPSWMDMKFEKQLITLIGEPPSTMNKEEIKIQIINHKGCIIRELNLLYDINYEEQQLDFKEEYISHAKRSNGKFKLTQFASRNIKSTQELEEKDQTNELIPFDLFTLDSTQGNRLLTEGKLKSERKKRSIFKLNKYSKNDYKLIPDQNYTRMSRRNQSLNHINQSISNIDHITINSP